MMAVSGSLRWVVSEAALLASEPLATTGAILVMREVVSRPEDAELGRAARVDNSELSW